ncbi:glycosyltransferase family 4 protein [Chryseobacterium sp.]|nr:glycosyltransferase family 4 protein [Chryseobacterium sp.]
MKILYCIPSLQNPGGMERILSEKINYLVQVYGYNVTVLTTDQRARPLFFPLDEDVKVVDFGYNFDLDFKRSLGSRIIFTLSKIAAYRKKLEAFLAEEQPEIMVSTGGKELEFLQSIRVNCKKVLEMHFSQNFRQQFLMAQNAGLLSRLVGQYRTSQLLRQTKQLDALVVLTKKDLEQWQRTHKNIYHIYNFSSFAATHSADVTRKRAIAVGKLDAQKGFDLLIDAWAQHKEELHNWTLDIYGQGEWKEKLSQKISFHELEGKIKLMGVSENIQEEMLNSSMFLFSSRFEGFALVFVEAMTCGLPVVSFDCPEGPAELIENDKNGILVPAEDVESFGKAITRLADREDLRRIMGSNAKKKAAEFSKEVIMRQWDGLFKTIGNRN